MDSGELLARVHSLVPDRGVRHELQSPDAHALARGARIVEQTLGPAAASVVERGAAFLDRELAALPAPAGVALVHSDWLPKNLLIDDGAIVGVIDWESPVLRPPAFDLALWEMSAGDRPHHRSDLLRLGYARVADPDAADAGWVPRSPSAGRLKYSVGGTPRPGRHRIRRCVDVIARYADA